MSQILGYVVLDKYDEMMQKLKSRVYESYRLERHPYLRLNDKGYVTFFIKDLDQWVKVTDWALSSYNNLLNMRCSPDFVANSLNVYSRIGEEHMNNLYSVYWSDRYSKKGVKKILAHYVKDEFTKPEYQQPPVREVNQPLILDSDDLSLMLPDEEIESKKEEGKGEVRYISTTLFKPLADYSVGNFVREHLGNDYTFFEGTMKPLMSSFRYITNNQIELDGRTTKLGLAFINSEFGYHRLDVAIYSMAVECTNQFHSRNERFRESIVHRRKSSEDFKVRVAKGIKNLANKLETYGKKIVDARNSVLKIDNIEEIRDRPPNRKFAQIPITHVDGIIEAFNEDPIYNNEGKITKWSLFNACTRYLRNKRELEDNNSFTNAVDSLI